MQAILDWLNLYSNLITALSTLTIALLTIFLWRENRFLRKAGSAPQVVAFLSPHPDGNGGVHFVLANVGRGPAFNVSFELLYDEQDFRAHEALLENDCREPISVLPQGEKLKFLLGIGYELFGKRDKGQISPLKPFDVRIKYSNILGHREVDKNYTIDIRQFAGLRGIVEKSNSSRTSEAMEKLEKHLSRMADQAARFSAFVDITQLSDAVRKKVKDDGSSG